MLFLTAKFIPTYYTAIKTSYTCPHWDWFNHGLLSLMGIRRTWCEQKLDKGVVHFYTLSSALATGSRSGTSAKLLEGCETHRGELPCPLWVHPRPAQPQATASWPWTPEKVQRKSAEPRSDQRSVHHPAAYSSTRNNKCLPFLLIKFWDASLCNLCGNR